MTSLLKRKTALIALVILLTLCCVLFACENKESVTIDFSIKGDVDAGSTRYFTVTISGAEVDVEALSAEEAIFEIISGGDVAAIEGNKLKIADTAHKGDVFSVKLTVKDISVVKNFTVALEKPIEIESVALTLSEESARAGDVIALSATVLPEGVDVLPIYRVISGNATIEGNLLKIAEDADVGVVVVEASAGGKVSPPVTISITTVQTRLLDLSLSRTRALPCERVNYSVEILPVESSYPIEITLEEGADIALLDTARGTLSIEENATLGDEIVLLARSGTKESRARLVVGYPAVEDIEGQGGIVQADYALRTIEYSVTPASADRSSVRISVEEGAEYIEWTGGETFRVLASAPVGEEITFLLEADEDVYHTITYKVGYKELSSLTISTSDDRSYLRSGYSVTFTATTIPAESHQAIYYRATTGADLVRIDGNVVTVKDGADIGTVTIVAESEDGTVSNEVEFTVSGRYVRREYTSWASVGFASSGENAGVWMVLPAAMNAGSLTVLVPYEVVDLVIEGRYDGSDETAYKDLYFYFRNTAQRTVTLWNFGTIATEGLGGTVFDLGSSGDTEIILKGQNLIRADSPYYIDNSGDETDGVWDNAYSITAQKLARRNGKSGYRGTAGGTAISGYSLTFIGQGGTLIAEAGSGVNGTAGGKGADAIYDGSFTYLSGSGGDGGHGGDSGAAIYAYNVSFLSGLVTALPGNAGLGGAGGAAGTLERVVGYDVTAYAGQAGASGENGTPYPAVNARNITGKSYVSSIGVTRSLSACYVGSLVDLTERISRFYGVNVLYGNKLENPYAKVFPRQNRYTMTQQTNATALMLQANFLMYTMSMIPKNAWREIKDRSGKTVTIYFCDKITSYGGNTILGLTNDKNNVWFATFGTDLRGIYLSGYFNIMLHEFVHVFHYNLTKSARSSMESALEQMNYGLDYKSTSSTERVYGVTETYTASNSCFFTSYSRKTVLEDAAETISIAATFTAKISPLVGDTRLREKVLFLSESFSRAYETLSPFITGKVLFGDRRLA